MLVPVLQSIVQGAALAGNLEVVIGMAHRGRLNVLTHVLKKPYRQMLSEFIKGKSTSCQVRAALDPVAIPVM